MLDDKHNERMVKNMDNRTINQVNEARRLTGYVITNFFDQRGHMRNIGGSWEAASEVMRSVYRRLCEIEIAAQNEHDEGRC